MSCVAAIIWLKVGVLLSPYFEWITSTDFGHTVHLIPLLIVVIERSSDILMLIVKKKDESFDVGHISGLRLSQKKSTGGLLGE